MQWRSTSCTYNFAAQASDFKVSPAMAAGVTDKLWSFEAVAKVVEEWEIS
jgi:hypothetical protein